jgi:hypothetical protein
MYGNHRFSKLGLAHRDETELRGQAIPSEELGSETQMWAGFAEVGEADFGET